MSSRRRWRTLTPRSTPIAPQDALTAVWRIVDELNGYITEQAPWKVAKD